MQNSMNLHIHQDDNKPKSKKFIESFKFCFLHFMFLLCFILFLFEKKVKVKKEKETFEAIKAANCLCLNPSSSYNTSLYYLFIFQNFFQIQIQIQDILNLKSLHFYNFIRNLSPKLVYNFIYFIQSEFLKFIFWIIQKCQKPSFLFSKTKKQKTKRNIKRLIIIIKE